MSRIKASELGRLAREAESRDFKIYKLNYVPKKIRRKISASDLSRLVHEAKKKEIEKSISYDLAFSRKFKKALLKIKYPKLLLLILTIFSAIILFQNAETYFSFGSLSVSLGYLGIFLSGIFYAYGFTAAPATAALLLLAEGRNILIAGLIGGFGALLSDIIIFLFIRHSFADEIEQLKAEKMIKILEDIGRKVFGPLYNYFLPTFVGFIIASPLPSEIGVALIATSKKISIKKFMLIAYLLHTLGIFIILLIGNAI